MRSNAPLHTPRSVPTTTSSTPLALEHYDPRPLRKVPIERWCEVFTRTGAPPGLSAPDTATIDEVVTALTRGALSPLFQDLLQTLHDFGSATGAHALHEGAVAVGIPRDDWPDGVEELAVEVWARARADASYERLLLVAEVGLHDRAAETRYREFFGRKPRPINRHSAETARLCAALSPWFQKEKMGPRVEVTILPEDDRVVFCLFHGMRRQFEENWDDSAGGMIGFRPPVCDVVTYEHLSGRLRITTRSKRIVELYRKVFGAVFFGDGDFFVDRPRYDLRPLAKAIEAGAMPSQSDSSDIHSVNLVDCLWTTGDNIQHRIHGLDGRDCMQQARRANFRHGEDQLAEVTLAFNFRSAERIERTEIVLRTGNQFKCRKPARRDAIEEYLTRIGARATPGEGTAQARPPPLVGVRSAAQWKACFGDRLTEACDLRVLRQASRAMVGPVGTDEGVGTDPVTRVELREGPMMFARDFEGDVRLVSVNDALGYEFDGHRLAELLRAELRCGLSLRPLPFEGVFDLGPITVGSATVRPFLLTAPSLHSPQTLTATLQNLVGQPARWIVILPHRASPDDWSFACPLRAPLPPFSARADIIATLGLTDQVTALERAGTERLVVDTQRHAAWLDEVQLNLSEKVRYLLELLAKAAKQGRAFPAGDLARELCNDGENKDLVRQRVRELSAAVRERMRAEGQASAESEKLVRSFQKGEGYRLVLTPYVE